MRIPPLRAISPCGLFRSGIFRWGIFRGGRAGARRRRAPPRRSPPSRNIPYFGFLGLSWFSQIWEFPSGLVSAQDSEGFLRGVFPWACKPDSWLRRRAETWEFRRGFAWGSIGQSGPFSRVWEYGRIVDGFPLTCRSHGGWRGGRGVAGRGGGAAPPLPSPSWSRKHTVIGVSGLLGGRVGSGCPGGGQKLQFSMIVSSVSRLTLAGFRLDCFPNSSLGLRSGGGGAG